MSRYTFNPYGYEFDQETSAAQAAGVELVMGDLPPPPEGKGR